MFTTELTLNTHLYLLVMTHVEAIPDERMVERADLNHAAWQLGHLALAYDFVPAALGQSTQLRRWQPLFAPGSKPVGDRGAYPSKAELVDAFVTQHERARAVLSQPIDPELMAKPNPFEPIRATLPTTRDLISYLLTGHVGIHLGQLSAWRRTCGI